MKIGDLVKHKGWKGHGIVIKLVREAKYTTQHDLYMVLCTDGFRNFWARRDCEVINEGR